MCPSPRVPYKHRLLPYSNEGCLFIPKPFFPYKTESQQSHPSSLSALAMPVQGSPMLEVRAGESPCMTQPVPHGAAPSPACPWCSRGTGRDPGTLLTHWDERLEQKVGPSLQGWYFSKRQGRAGSVPSAASSTLCRWGLREACP